ncbi:MAG: methionine synthase [Paludibacteraceae bacterium]|nr:methionine synthase [Paludibacteraceae bacterium]
MGTMLQRLGTDTSDIEKLSEGVYFVHKRYIDAGADIITTNTFTANEGADIRERNLRFASVARRAADECKERKIYVAGDVGPTSKTLTMDSDASFDELQKNYRVQIKALKDGGVDLLLFETFFDTLNLKAALTAAGEIAPELPKMISATIEKSGRMLTGQTLDAFAISVAPFNPFSIGLNCSFGAKDMLPYIKRLSAMAGCYVSAHPNAGLPDENGRYTETPESMAEALKAYFDEGLLNIVGGCCGTTPEHIKMIAETASTYKPREIPVVEQMTMLSGLEPLDFSNFVYVGERTNVAGSKKFAKLIASGNYDEALTVARHQVEGGAQVIDVCMDDSMLDAVSSMNTFLQMAGADPYIAKVPVMIDSSSWDVIKEALKHVGGKAIVNSISLKEGVETFKERAEYIKSFGAAVIVMAFDEQGQAVTYNRKIEICKRAYDILVKEVGFNPYDIVFDPNVLTIATGIKEHNNYAVDFIRTVEYVKNNLKGAKTSGGISNLSFAFRGNNAVREAMHSVFLYYAVKAGLDMAIVNPQMLQVYDNIEPQLRKMVTDVILNRFDNAVDELLSYASKLVPQNGTGLADVKPVRGGSVEERLKNALVSGSTEFVEADVNEALNKYKPLEIVEGVLMDGISTVGKMFGEGKMFLPQVVKSASVMKKAVSYILPHIPQGESSAINRTVVIATVSGDVHDIGKNIMGVVLTCNGYNVIDLGVMVPADTIIDSAISNNAVAICVSGLITPSLSQMIDIAKGLQNRQLQIPLIVGGATTSDAHTAMYIDTVYDGIVEHSADASMNVRIVNDIVRNPLSYKRTIKAKYADMRLSLVQKSPIAADKSVRLDWNGYTPVSPLFTGIKVFNDFTLSDIAPHINWKAYAAAWEVPFDKAEQLIENAKKILDKDGADITVGAELAIYKAHTLNDTVIVNTCDCGCCGVERFEFARHNGVSLSDFISPDKDYIGMFAVSVNAGKVIERYKSENADVEAMSVQLLADRLAEATSEYLFDKTKQKWWRFNKGIRPAIGYSCLPDHTMKRQLLRILDAEKHIGITLTESSMMIPVSSVCGFYIANDNAKYF